MALKIWFLAAFALLMLVAPAHAQTSRWWRGESDNFIVYGDRNEEQVRGAAQALEDFDAALRTITNTPREEAESKFEVYLVRGTRGLRDVRPGVSETTGGFYVSGTSQIAAFLIYSDLYGLDRQEILFHEYAHHFMLHNFPHAYPRWYVEGWAEYVSTTIFRDRRAIVGTPSEERGGWLGSGGLLPVLQLLAPERVRLHTRDFTASFYASSWFATMYVLSRPERLRGLNTYVTALGDGADPIDAFQPAFGITPAEFESELRVFRRQRVATFSLPLPAQPANVVVSRLSPAANDLLLPLARVRMARDYGDTIDPAMLEGLAASHQNDPMGRIALAHAALLRRDYTSARGQLDALLAADEAHAEARHLLASAILLDAEDANPAEHNAAVSEARRHLARNFRTNPSHFPTLYTYAVTFLRRDRPLAEDQLNVLARAVELAPRSSQMRTLLARELMKAERWDDAIATLRPLIYAPHGGASARYARAMFDAARNRQPPPEFNQAQDGDEDSE